MLTIDHCRERQRRLLAEMERHGLADVVVSNPKTVYYFSGALVDASWPQVFVMKASGDNLLITNNEPAQHAAARIERYTGYTIERSFGRDTAYAEAAAIVESFLSRAAGPVGIEAGFTGAAMVAAAGPPGLVNVTPLVNEMRRHKDPDELECIREAIRLTETGYAAVKQALQPGMTEFEAYLVIHEAMVNAAGTSVELRGDFAAATRAINGGGPPTRRKLEHGDLYIFDLFPVVDGYCCDLCRTFVVGEASELQQNAWSQVMEGHAIASRLIRPGVTGREIYQAVRAHLDRFEPASDSFRHHLGHGVGMDGWEYPWLNAGGDLALIEGEVIACEPGLYAEVLRGGVRLEHNYLVGAQGPAALDSFPMEL
ncbi:MAG: aminopeptidase P family protein [Acidobacteria bacterium]|nr:aminopeptidase P family protein [Acidobacteriota bacterium]